MSIRLDDRESNGLRSALGALAESDATAIFIVWQEDLNPAQVSGICRSAGLVPTVIPPGHLDWIEPGFQGGDARDRNTAWILPGCLSTLHGEDRIALNDSRERILALGRKLIFVEPYGEESSLREDYPDIFGVARRSFHLEIIGNDELFDNGNANSLESLRRAYPPSSTRGSIVFVQGKPNFKASPKIPCPKGHGFLQRGQTMIAFQHAPTESRVQAVDGWVCLTCGEAYVPGAIASRAYRRAFSL
jgi:hypothetical protein